MRVITTWPIMLHKHECVIFAARRWLPCPFRLHWSPRTTDVSPQLGCNSSWCRLCRTRMRLTPSYCPQLLNHSILTCASNDLLSSAQNSVLGVGLAMHVTDEHLTLALSLLTGRKCMQVKICGHRPAKQGANPKSIR